MPSTAPGPDNLPHVLALGGGYATISLYKKLAGAIRRRTLRLTIVDRNNFNCYHGLVPEMLTGKIQPGNILSPLRTIFRRARFRNGEVENIDLEAREVLFTRSLDGREFRVNYDHLALDLGSVENLKLFPGMAEHSLRLKSFPDILQARHHLITMLELADIEQDPAEVERLLNFVVAGGNYAGVEVAGEMAAALPRMARARFPNLPVDKIRVTLVHAGDKILPELGASFPRLQDYTMRMLQQYPNMRLVTHCRMAAATPEEAILDTGERIPTRTIISCTGATPSPLLDRLPFERTATGRLVMDKYCRVQGQTHVWAGGDCAAVPRRDGTPAPPLAIWALTAGARIGGNIKRALAGRELKPFRFTGLGDACIFGDKRAAGHLRGVQMRGKPGYYVWRLICLLYVPDWEKKWRVFMDWMLLPFFGSDVVNMNVHKPVGVTRVMYEAGQDIVREGDVGQSMFIVRTGEVEVLRQGENGAQAVLATLGPGDHFGEVAVFRRMRRTATVRSKTRVELLHLRREVALALSESASDIAASLSSQPHDMHEHA
jgi:NADH dehydrogenase